MKTNKNIKTLSEFKDEHYGKVGSAKRGCVCQLRPEFRPQRLAQIRERLSRFLIASRRALFDELI